MILSLKLKRLFIDNLLGAEDSIVGVRFYKILARWAPKLEHFVRIEKHYINIDADPDLSDFSNLKSFRFIDYNEVGRKVCLRH